MTDICSFEILSFQPISQLAWLIQLSRARTGSRMVEMLDARESEKDEDSDCPSWGDNVIMTTIEMVKV